MNSVTQNKKLPTFSPLPTSLDDSDLVAPVMWFEDAVVSPPADLMLLLRDALETGPRLGAALAAGFLMLLAMELVLLAGWHFWTRDRERNLKRNHMDLIDACNDS